MLKASKTLAVVEEQRDDTTEQDAPLPSGILKGCKKIGNVNVGDVHNRSGIPSGCESVRGSTTGGVASLNHRLMSVNPTGSAGLDGRNEDDMVANEMKANPSG